MTGQKNTIKVNLYLHKEELSNFDECIKEEHLANVDRYNIKDVTGLDGKIFVHETVKKTPVWLSLLNNISREKIKIGDNSSNKALIVLKHRKRLFSITYGHGKSLLNESTVVKDFGLITCVNLISPEKIKSLNSISIEDVIVDTQKQSSGTSSQDQFQVDKFKEILKSISGAPTDENVAKFLSGSDSINITKYMNIMDIKDTIKNIYKAYKKDNYKQNGFGWLDNIRKVKDKETINILDKKLCEAILSDSESIIIAPNKIINWEEINGFYIKGMNNEELSIEVESETYFNHIKEKNKDSYNYIISKLKRDTLIAVNYEENHNSLGNIYSSLLFECRDGDNYFIFTYGGWYEVKNDYYQQVTSFVDEIPISNLKLPDHDKQKNEHEGNYNERITENNPKLVLMDKKNYSPKEYGSSRVEPCDVLSKDKQFIHIKRGMESSTLSHLFSQATVSSSILTNDDRFREHINFLCRSKFGKDFIPKTFSNSSLEIVFAIIVEKEHSNLSDYLPFFSRVNLMRAVNQLKSSQFKYSYLIIKSV